KGVRPPLRGTPLASRRLGARSATWSHGSAKRSQPCDARVGARCLPTVWGGQVGALVNDFRVEGVARSVTYEVPAQHGDRDHQARERDPPPVAVDEVLLSACEDRAPADGGRLDAETQEADERLEDDVAGDAQREGDNDRAHSVRQQVAKDD